MTKYRVDFEIPEIEHHESSDSKPLYEHVPSSAFPATSQSQKNLLCFSGFWRFKQAYCKPINPSYNVTICNLTESLTRVRALTSDFSNRDLVNTNSTSNQLYKASWNLVNTLECYAPQNVDDLGHSILLGTEESIDASSIAALRENITIKDMSWKLVNIYNQQPPVSLDFYSGNRVYMQILTDNHLATCDSNLEFKISPFLFAVLTKQNKLALKIATKAKIDPNLPVIGKLNVYEILWIIDSKLIHNLKGKYLLEIFQAYFSIADIIDPESKFSLNSQLMFDLIERLTLEQKQTLYKNFNFSENILQRHDIRECLKRFFEGGLDVNAPVFDDGESSIFAVIRDKNYIALEFLLENQASLTQANANGLTAFQLLTEEFLLEIPTSKLLLALIKYSKEHDLTLISESSCIAHQVLMQCNETSFRRAHDLCSNYPDLLNVKDEKNRSVIELFYPVSKHHGETDEIRANHLLQQQMREHYDILFDWMHFNSKRRLSFFDNLSKLKVAIIQHGAQEFFYNKHPVLFKRLFMQSEKKGICNLDAGQIAPPLVVHTLRSIEDLPTLEANTDAAPADADKELNIAAKNKLSI